MQPIYLFLLGGQDLEMITIRSLLVQNNALFIDKNLEWNSARISMFKDVLFDPSNADKIIYGIELTDNHLFPLPTNYKSIDHHNERGNEKTSLEQVADILGTALTHDQQLVAANDRGYIPAMVEMGATPEEIKDIRHRDQQAIGVTANDILLAKESIARNLQVVGEVLVVRALTSRFTVISDFLYPYKNLLIYKDSELTVFGHLSLKLQKRTEFHELKPYYRGDSSNGFWGFSNCTVTEEIVTQIIKTLNYG